RPCTYALLYGRHGAGPSQRSQSTTSRGGVGSAGIQAVSTAGVYTEAYSVWSLPSLPLWASRTAAWKLATLRRCVPAWNTRLVWRIVSSRAWHQAMVRPHGFSL